MKTYKVLTYAVLLGLLAALLAGCNESSGRVGGYGSSQLETEWQHEHPNFRAEAYQ